MKAEEYLKQKGMHNVGHYGLLISDPSKQNMHQIMEDYAELYHRSRNSELPNDIDMELLGRLLKFSDRY